MICESKGTIKERRLQFFCPRDTPPNLKCEERWSPNAKQVVRMLAEPAPKGLRTCAGHSVGAGQGVKKHCRYLTGTQIQHVLSNVSSVQHSCALVLVWRAGPSSPKGLGALVNSTILAKPSRCPLGSSGLPTCKVEPIISSQSRHGQYSVRRQGGRCGRLDADCAGCVVLVLAGVARTATALRGAAAVT